MRQEALLGGMAQEKIHEFANAHEAAEKLKAVLQPGDVVLVKASQSEYFEDILKEIMAEPERASDLLLQRDYTRV